MPAGCALRPACAGRWVYGARPPGDSAVQRVLSPGEGEYRPSDRQSPISTRRSTTSRAAGRRHLHLPHRRRHDHLQIRHVCRQRGVAAPHPGEGRGTAHLQRHRGRSGATRRCWNGWARA